MRAALSFVVASGVLFSVVNCVGNDPETTSRPDSDASAGEDATRPRPTEQGGNTTDANPDPGSKVCEPQQRKCDGNTLKKCTADGLGYADDEVCANGCNAANAQCNGCAPGKYRCNGKRLEKCKGNGTLFELDKECPSGDTCDEPGAKCLVCPTADALVCVGAESHTCNADRLGTTVKTKCGSLGCDPNTKDCVKCNPTLAQCNNAEFCDAPNCSTNGICTPRPNGSTTLALTCGCDGVTYWNKQHANFMGKTTNASGLCTGVNAKTCSPVKPCNTAAGEYCNIQHNPQTALCSDTPPNPPSISHCLHRPIVNCGSGGFGNGGQSCGGVCLNECQIWAGTESKYSDNCP